MRAYLKPKRNPTAELPLQKYKFQYKTLKSLIVRLDRVEDRVEDS